MNNWLVYIILCSDESLYTGITNNLTKRLHQHNKLSGAKYFRARKAIAVVYLEEGHNRSSASKREVAIKQLNRAEKLKLIEASGCQQKNR